MSILSQVVILTTKWRRCVSAIDTWELTRSPNLYFRCCLGDDQASAPSLGSLTWQLDLAASLGSLI
ncbi:hypothetical protein [Microcoleus sp. herbarium12]|uniref:hypothetical protein n=1 Tax=Microcoleus sp. herbarium12 TaxID=3055437 RepID=UPI002FD5523D